MAQVELALIFVGDFSDAEKDSAQANIETYSSAIYEQQGLYISGIKRFRIPSSDPDFKRFRTIEFDGPKGTRCNKAESREANDMRRDWDSGLERVDVFMVESFAGDSCATTALGFSPKNGPTDKASKLSGVVMRMPGFSIEDGGSVVIPRFSPSDNPSFGQAVAHEVGHYLGLDSGPGDHSPVKTNFMYFEADSSRTAINHDQYQKMTKHGFVRRFAP